MSQKPNQSKLSCIVNSVGGAMLSKFGRRSKEYDVEDTEFRTHWRSIYIVALVAFIGSVHTNCINPGIWPYMKKMIPDVTENFYGIMHSLSGIGIVLAAPLAGYVSNRLHDTTCILYMAIELVGIDSKRVFFIVFELLLGLSIGAANIYRAHVAVASTEADRPKAVAITSLAPAIGIFAGPLSQIIFTTLGYPGIEFLFKTHINLYTAPILMTIIISLIGSFLLIFCFDGKMRIFKKYELEEKQASEIEATSIDNSISEDTSDAHEKYDKVAFFICLYTKMLLNFCTMNFHVIGIPYTMTAFEWSSENTILYISVCMVLIGINICCWNLSYILFDLRNKLSERKAVLISIFGLLTAYLLTYPWPFINETIPYQKLTDNSTEGLGCRPDFAWCATTPRVNMWIFLGSLITVLGFAFPLCQINLDILFSKVLGNIKQGTLQSHMIISGEFLSIFGPILFTKVYTISGPIYIWQFEIAVICISIVLWFVFYNRMISKTKRLAQAKN